MIRRARAFFLSRALREKLLLVAFVAIGMAWWASAYATRFGAFWREQRLTTVNLAVQTEWIKNKDRIEDTAKKTVSSLDPTKTLNGNQLVTEVLQLGKEAGLKSIQTFGGTENSTTGQFAVHSQDYQVRDAEWEELKSFYKALQRRSPYLAIERFILESPNNSPRHLLRLRVTSVEIVR
jgi:hypothetical protein